MVFERGSEGAREQGGGGEADFILIREAPHGLCVCVCVCVGCGSILSAQCVWLLIISGRIAENMCASSTS